MAGRPNAFEADSPMGEFPTGRMHLFRRTGEMSLCADVSWLEVVRAKFVSPLTWICAGCRAAAAGRPRPW